jgi:hypothetical protein
VAAASPMNLSSPLNETSDLHTGKIKVIFYFLKKKIAGNERGLTESLDWTRR